MTTYIKWSCLPRLSVCSERRVDACCVRADTGVVDIGCLLACLDRSLPRGLEDVVPTSSWLVVLTLQTVNK